MDVVRHEVPLDYLHPLPLAELPEDLPQVLAVLVVDCFPSILWAKHDVVLAHPFGVRKAVRFLCHGVLLSLAAGDLNNHHPRGKGVLLHSISVIHPHSGWFFALCASHAGQAHEPQQKTAPEVSDAVVMPKVSGTEHVCAMPMPSQPYWSVPSQPY